MYEKYLSAAGLSPNEATVFETLLNEGELTASQVHKKTPFKRGLVYKLLDELVEKSLVIKTDAPNRVSTFKTEHPYKINELIDVQSKKLNYYKKSIDELMPQLVSNYNLAFNKPGIKFYEGKDGIRRVLADTLTSKELIYSYADIETVEKYTGEINREYRKKRNKLDIKKRVIMLDSSFARKIMRDYDPQAIEVRFLDHQKYPFTCTMQIYENKVAYISLSKDNYIALLVSDKNIFQMHKALFEFHWIHARAYDSLPPLSNAQ